VNITLINPKLETWSPNVYAPLGLAYIASALVDAGHLVSIVDMNSGKISDEKLVEKINHADMVGITGLITEYNEVIRLTNVVKQKSAARIILGGALATTHTEKLLVSSCADYIVMGEGERTIVKLVSAIEYGQSVRDVKGIAYKDWKVIINPPADPIENLDSVAYPARYLLDMNRYTTHHFKSYGMNVGNIKSTTMISSRSCPFSCTFCFSDVFGKKWRGRSPENMLGEIKQLHDNYGFNGIVFNDDTFVVDKKRALDFCKLLINSGLRIKWYCNGRVNLMSQELIDAMKESGCVGIAYGIESGSQEILDSVKKGITIDQITKVVGMTKKAGIYVTGYFMIGILGDSKATIQQTFDLARKLDLDFYGFGMTSPIIGTAMHKEAQKQGFIEKEELKDWSFHASVNMTTDCSDKDLENFNKDAFREFTIEKRFGKYYLFNPLLWLDGLKSLIFLMRKRNANLLIKKAWELIG
jgi:anaerobic magnesium-protoporphyrin IX monomethyl ester cyclase